MAANEHQVVVECHDRSPLTVIRFAAGLVLLIVTLAGVVPAEDAGGIVRVGFLVLGVVLSLEGGWHLLKPRPPWWVAVRDDSLEWGRGETPSESIRLPDVSRIRVDASSGTAEGVYFDVNGNQRVLPLGLMSYSDLRNIASAIHRRFPELPLEYSGEIPPVDESPGKPSVHQGLPVLSRFAVAAGSAVAVGLIAVLTIKQPWRGLRVPGCVGLHLQECIMKTGASFQRHPKFTVSKGADDIGLLRKDDAVWEVVIKNERISRVRELPGGKSTAMAPPDEEPAAADAANEKGPDEPDAENPPPAEQPQEEP